MQSQHVLQRLLLDLARRAGTATSGRRWLCCGATSAADLARRAGTATSGRRWLCCGATSAADRRRNMPRYRFELENRLLFGDVLREIDHVSPAAAAAVPESAPPPRLTIVSETGFPEVRVGVPARSRSATAAPVAASAPAPIRARPPVVPPSTGYLYPVEEEGEGAQAGTEPAARLPSVSRVLQATMSEESRAALRRWEEMMVARHGPDGFARLKQAMFSTGREVHEAIHSHLLGCGPERSLSTAAAGFWRSVRPVLQHVDAGELAAAELPLRHPQLGYQGVVDCVAPFRSCPMVIEWKTARRSKNSVRDLYDNPVQAAAYLGAYNYMHRKAQVNRAAVVVAYESGRPATVHVLSPTACRHYWSVWLQRLLRYTQTDTL